MGAFASRSLRPFRNFNIESRAQKEISKDKPTPAPKHKSNVIDYERALQEYPEQYKESLKYDEKLGKHLKDVYVMSHDPNIKLPPPNPNRPLPMNRNVPDYYEYGFKEPENVPHGKVTLKQAIEFISGHYLDAAKFSVLNIAKDYHLPEETVKDILKYYRCYEVFQPNTAKGKPSKAFFAGATIKRPEVVKHERKMLTEPTETKKLAK